MQVVQAQQAMAKKLGEAKAKVARLRISAAANPKSSTGRLDIFTRVIAAISCRLPTAKPIRQPAIE